MAQTKKEMKASMHQIQKALKKTVKSEREVTLEFQYNDGWLNIEVLNSDPKYRNKKVAFVINGTTEQIDIDNDGNAMVVFEDSDPPVQNTVKIKDKGTLKNSQSLMFFY